LMEGVHGLGGGQFTAGLGEALGGNFLEKRVKATGFDEVGDGNVLGGCCIPCAACNISAQHFPGQFPGLRFGLFPELLKTFEIVVGGLLLLPVRRRILLHEDALLQLDLQIAEPR